MKNIIQIIFTSCLLFSYAPLICASENAPWGKADTLDTEYEPKKVLYDLTSADKKHLSRLLDRAGYLYKLYGSDPLDSSIVVIIHGDAIPFFAINAFNKHEDLMRRAQSLTVGTSIEFRMCLAAAKLSGYGPDDIHGFVTMVPMADAEIARLQHDGYAYMH